MHKTNRGLLGYILLSAITFGIYPFYFIHRVSVELNEGCKEDGKNTAGLLAYVLFSLITFGIYAIVWMCKCSSRMEQFYFRKSENPRISAMSYLCWSIFGTLLFGIGPLVATYKFIHALNDVNMDYNNKNKSKY